MVSKKRAVAITIGILIILLLLAAVAYFSGVTGNVITSPAIILTILKNNKKEVKCIR
ncbi:MAG: hypothetical protein WC494_00460 [Candidatus Pacearchaeota archaeon]